MSRHGRRQNKKSKKKHKRSEVLHLKKSYPKNFCIEVPKTKDGKLIRDKQGFPEIVKEYGMYTCFHIAHREDWKKYLYKENKKVIDQVYRRIEGKEEDGIVVIQPPRKKSRK